MSGRMLAHIKESIGKMLAKTTLFTVRSKFNSQLNIMLTKYLVDELGLKGAYICLERPSYYVERLLKARGVDMQRIVLLDAISKVSGDQKLCEETSSKVIENPFSKEFLASIIGNEDGRPLIDIDELDFLIIDSLSVLSCYIDDESLVHLLETLSESFHVPTLMTVDSSCDTDLYEKARSMCKKEIRFKDDMSVESVDH